MCGITGYINPRGVKRSEIEEMNDVIRHRGPDDDGVYISSDHTVGLGHRRLSIIDIGTGQQPMTNEDGTLWITFNGEIYNYQEIRPVLEKRHTFKTKSDTEVILHLYEEKGERCLEYLRGMFSLAIYDTRQRKLFAARDHLGQKPLYYYHGGNEFAFSSEIKSLLELKPELREMDCRALYEYLTIRIITPPRSMFSKIRKLPPAHWLTFHDGKLTMGRYWNLTYEPKMDMDFNETLAELESKVEETVKYHLVSDVPVGAFLSGGMDSSIIVSMMSKVGASGFKTFSGDVPYQNYSELPFAKLVSDQYGTDHHELTIKPSLVRKLPDLVWHLDEPSDPLSVCMYYISELARKEVKVVLGGDGGDELFGGYDRYYGNIYTSYYAMIPERLRKHIFGRIFNAMPDQFWYRSISHKLKWMHQMSFSQNGMRYAKSLSYFYFSDRYKHQLYTDKFRKAVGMFDPEACLSEYFDASNAVQLIDKMLYVDAMTRMPDHPNMILDRMTMAHGLEARSPFLDHRLAEFCAAMPPEFKIKGIKRRYIQVQLAKKYLPKELITKKKQGFSSPLTYLLKDQFKLLYEIFLRDSRLVSNGYLNQKIISLLLEEHLNQISDHGNRLWLICNAEVWYRMYIENQSRDQIKSYLGFAQK
ncbi:MAG: asparagine synthase (glutamine-hydrolyzing) [Thermodesulfobacteriota bacterium]|nr:asparagine synthase (glutamine-hydrolyzing) [Thermodesulfobacteriota bacterium]